MWRAGEALPTGSLVVIYILLPLRANYRSSSCSPLTAITHPLPAARAMLGDLLCCQRGCPAPDGAGAVLGGLRVGQVVALAVFAASFVRSWLHS